MKVFISAMLCLFLSSGTNASLVGRDLDGNTTTAEAYYDDDLDITWLADANLALTNTFGVTAVGHSGNGIDSDGRMDWATVNAWLTAVNSDNGTGYLGVNTWRVPVIASSCEGYCPEGEFGHLFYNELGGTFSESIFTSTDPDLSLFSNINTGVGGYWYTSAYSFRFNIGSQQQEGIGLDSHVWLVTNGDVGASIIPIPAAAWLFGSGLMCLIGLARCKV